MLPKQPQGNVETTLNRIFDGSLPPHLKAIPRDSTMADLAKVNGSGGGAAQPPRRTDGGLGQRRNVYDNDEFDVFSGRELDLSRVHRGKRSVSGGGGSLPRAFPRLQPAPPSSGTGRPMLKLICRRTATSCMR